MEIGKVLVINNGFSKPSSELENGVTFHSCGIPEITPGQYSAIVLEWVNGIIIGDSSSHSSDRIISTDIHRVIEIIREKMAHLNTKKDVPVLVESATREVSGLNTLSPLEISFLIQRIVSKNVSNTRNLALVNPPNIPYNSWARGDAQDISHKYPHIKFHFGSPFDCVYDIAEGEAFDSVSLFHHIGKYYPKLLEKRRIVGEDTKTYFHRNTQYTLKKSPDFTSVKESYQTVFPCALINEFPGGCSRHHIECLKVHISPELDIPDFLDKCPKV